MPWSLIGKTQAAALSADEGTRQRPDNVAASVADVCKGEAGPGAQCFGWWCGPAPWRPVRCAQKGPKPARRKTRAGGDDRKA